MTAITQSRGLVLSALVAVAAILAFALAGCSPVQGPAPAAQPTEAAGAQESTATEEAPAAAPAAVLPIPTETYKDIPVGFTPEGFPFRGDPNAPVKIVEYSDFQCPFCARYFVQTEPALDDAYVRAGKVMVIFRDFPIEQIHPAAPAAHVAALCAADQGAPLYWAMHEKLFQTQTEWSNSLDPNAVFTRLGEEIGADVDALKSCLEDPAAKQQIIATALQDGQAAGVTGTPSFQLAGAGDARYLLVGAQPFEEFARNVDALAAGEEPPIAQQQQQQEQQGEAQIPFWATKEGWQPDAERPGFNMAGDQYRGNLDAKVTVIEFSDYQCPYCKRHVDETQPALDEKFVDSGDVLWVFKNYPLDFHPQAIPAAIAAECAADQEKFWEMHEALFASVEQWSVNDTEPVFTELATAAGLDVDAFKTCLQDGAAVERVTSDVQDGAPFVQGTPTFIVLFNDEGRIIPGALPLDQFTAALQEIVDQAQ
jgi:protein-disulfide isomerase